MASLSDILTTSQNIVRAFNSFSQSNIDLSGQKNTLNLSTTTLVKTGSGRIATLSITTAGTASGGLFDAATVDAATSANLLVVVPDAIGVFAVNMTYQNGLVYIPGTGQTAAICYT
jgi:hypothetical protein